MTYKEWMNETVPEYKALVASDVARVLVDEYNYHPYQAKGSNEYDYIERFVSKLLEHLRFLFSERVILAQTAEFGNKLTLLLIDIIPQYLNELNKYGYMEKYFKDEEFGYQNLTDSRTALGTLPISTVNEDYDEFNVAGRLKNGYEKSQTVDTNRAFDYQDTVRRNLAYGQFWRLNIFNTVINRLEPLFLGTLVHEW